MESGDSIKFLDEKVKIDQWQDSPHNKFVFKERSLKNAKVDYTYNPRPVNLHLVYKNVFREKLFKDISHQEILSDFKHSFEEKNNESGKKREVQKIFMDDALFRNHFLHESGESREELKKIEFLKELFPRKWREIGPSSDPYFNSDRIWCLRVFLASGKILVLFWKIEDDVLEFMGNSFVEENDFTDEKQPIVGSGKSGEDHVAERPKAKKQHAVKKAETTATVDAPPPPPKAV